MADTTRRLRSNAVVLGGVGILAVALTACSSDPDKRCVDRDSYDSLKGYKVVSDKNCKSSSGSSHTVWYYGGNRSNGYVDGGSLTKSRKSSGGSSSSSGGSGGVDRGGFGAGDGGHGSSGG
ncbi:hypothetical protein [Streptomyces acidiscabies]|uniref:hypothetical protein n=1 Tax=Streptomyces acidiscabies TaxID=42234 RepID=UPI00095367CA|nr:hypothetical protein [Streptomyces acidiscabies]